MNSQPIDIQKTVIQALKKAIGTKTEGEIIQPDTPLSNLGMNSLKIIEVIFELENRFGIQVDEEELTKLNSVMDLVSAVANAYARSAA